MRCLNSGQRARSFTGPQVGLVTDSVHTRARIRRISAERIAGALDAGEIAVVAGFQGTTESGDITTLGRGGSDLTAVALAAALKADRCIIFTDVDGVYTSDPNIVPLARRIDKIAYEEMLEMASLGAKVLQSRSVEFAAKFNVPVEVNSSFKEGKGTLVTREDDDMEAVAVSGITGDRNQAKITIVGVPDKPGIASKLFGPVATAKKRDRVGAGPAATTMRDIDLACHALQDIKQQLKQIARVGGGEPSTGLLLAAADDCPEAVIVTDDEAQIRMWIAHSCRVTTHHDSPAFARTVVRATCIVPS